MSDHSIAEPQLFPPPFTTDVFAVPYKDGYILYIPKSGIVAGVDQRVGKLVKEIRSGDAIPDTIFHRQWIEGFKQMHLFDPPAENGDQPLGDFCPTHVTLSLTSRCQLRCIYCYARGGEMIADMPEEIMHAAIDLVADNAALKKLEGFSVTFHGEGEPTANPHLLANALNYAAEVGRHRCLKVTFSMSTNAMWNAEQRSLIAQFFQQLSVSMDGLPEIQNRQRPTATQMPSFPTVVENLRFLDANKISYGIRATVLPDSMELMVPFIRWIAAELSCKGVHFEPVFLSGRATDMKEPDRASLLDRFMSNFNHALVEGAEHGIVVSFSGCRAESATGHFCGATGPEPNFLVTTRGRVSSCFEIHDSSSPKGQFMIYGQYDLTSRSFVWDKDRLSRIRHFSVKNLEHCRDCFARWNCAGDCFAHADLTLTDQGDVTGGRKSPRCQVNQQATLDGLIRQALATDPTIISDKTTVDSILST